MQVDFKILEEEEGFLAVDKPAGLLVHPTKPGGPPTLLDGLGQLLVYEIANGGQVGIVNRLDRETSGVVLAAKTAVAARELGRAMKSRSVRKLYVALCFGWPREERFEVDEPLRRVGEVVESKVWLKRGTGFGGQEAKTRFAVLQKFRNGAGEEFSLVAAEPETGRTHQIRVHLAHAGVPVVGDKLYARGEEWYLRFVDGGWTAEMEGVLRMRRHALHSLAMGFVFCGKEHLVISSLPADMASFLCGNGGEIPFILPPPWNQSVSA